jgi:hypothetical protein
MAQAKIRMEIEQTLRNQCLLLFYKKCTYAVNRRNSAGATCGIKSVSFTEVIMTRDDVLKLFPDATDDQITNLLNQNNSEVATEKNKAKQYREKAGTADELQKKLDELEAGNLSEIEKANKALDAANQQIAELQKNNAIRDQREAAMTNFKITAEQAKTVVKDDGSLDYESLGKIMSEKETAAAQAKEQEIAKHQDVPGGGSAGGKDKDKTADVENAEKITFGNPASNSEAKNSYVI